VRRGRQGCSRKTCSWEGDSAYENRCSGRGPRSAFDASGSPEFTTRFTTARRQIVKYARKLLVRKGGLEPPRSCDRQPLKLVRLPIPPLSLRREAALKAALLLNTGSPKGLRYD
jgi:hypothetical protein